MHGRVIAAISLMTMSAGAALAQNRAAPAARPAPAAAAPTVMFPLAQTCAPVTAGGGGGGRGGQAAPAAGGQAAPAGAQAAQGGQGGRGGSPVDTTYANYGAVGLPSDSQRIAGNRARGGTGIDNVSVRTLATAGVPGNGVLGGVCMTSEDSLIASVVARLDFENYKSLLRGLGEFGDRWAGNPVGPGNAKAVDWIEAQLKSYGYTTERIKYSYQGSPREEVYATKVGSTTPNEMYILGAHMDGRGGGAAINDDGSGTALVMEIARVLSSPDIQTGRSIRFCLWNNEETGLNGAQAYVDQRQLLQGIETPAGSKKYNEPKWLGIIQHDMLLWDHGNPPMIMQSLSADVNVEFQLNSAKAAESAQLGVTLINSNRLFATNYPAQLSNSMSNTDTGPFMNLIPSVSLRDGRRLYEMGRGSSPTYHQPTDIIASFTDQDYRLGFNAIQTTLGAVTKLTGMKIIPKS